MPVILQSLDDGHLLITEDDIVYWVKRTACFMGTSLMNTFPTDNHAPQISVVSDDNTNLTTLSIKETTTAGIVRVVWSVELQPCDSFVAFTALMKAAMSLQTANTAYTAQRNGLQDWKATATKLEGLFQKEKSTLLHNFCTLHRQSQLSSQEKLQAVSYELAVVKDELAAANALLAPDDTKLPSEEMVDQLAAGTKVKKPSAVRKKPATKKTTKVAKPKTAAAKQPSSETKPPVERATRSTRQKRKQPPSPPPPQEDTPVLEPNTSAAPELPNEETPMTAVATPHTKDTKEAAGKGFAAWLDSSDDDDAKPPNAIQPNLFAKRPVDSSSDDTDEDVTSFQPKKTANEKTTTVLPKKASKTDKEEEEEEDFADQNMEDDIMAQLAAMEQG